MMGKQLKKHTGSYYIIYVNLSLTFTHNNMCIYLLAIYRFETSKSFNLIYFTVPSVLCVLSKKIVGGVLSLRGNSITDT